ncbi:unnamed protein product [Owenia fusiformis]|uniref:Uncharacterized protein n=1 Tax=Owenia fusiformis TaxID=6347 RepID=A0A8J1U388_OWEFU|nr:unnamed protein product [Owenia fusiformis]
MVDVDVFVSNNALIDMDIYHLWLDGYSAHEATRIQQKRGIQQLYGATSDMLIEDIMDHYRMFTMLEKFLQTPQKLASQKIFQIKPEMQKALIEKYYEFNPLVVRELLGKKLSSKHRKDLDDVSEKTKVPLKSCRRQFDNIKRVFKTVEEMLGSLVENIKQNYLVSDELANKYAAIVFITNNRFETGKRKLFYLSLDDFVCCAMHMISRWSYSAMECKHHHDMDVDLDISFLQDCRELRTLQEKEILDEHKTLTCRSLQGKISDKSLADLDSNFKNMSKILVNIAYNMNHARELKDIFIDLVEKFIEPCRQVGWTYTELETFLNVYGETCWHLDTFPRGQQALLKTWDRYINTISTCILQMYHT